MASHRKSWREKLLDDKGLPRVDPITPPMSQRWGTGTVVIPAPIEVDAAMRRVHKGRLTTINQLRSHLATLHHATIACPITTGIFAWIAAHAAEEDREVRGAKRITPWWRTLKADGSLNPKYPGGLERQQELLEAEGHTIVAKGRRLVVEDFEHRLARLDAPHSARVTA